jgi:Acetyltransferase (GNAT) domain
MITISKRLKGIIPYRIILWPTESVVREMAESLPRTEVARIDIASIELLTGRCLVDRNLSLTLAIDLRRDLEQIYKDLIPNARIRVHKAEKLGDRVTVRRYTGLPGQDNLIDKFVLLYNNFIAGKTASLFPISKALIASYFPNAEIILVELDGEPICGHLNLLDRESGVSRMFWSASRRFEDHATTRLAGILNVYLHWYEIEKYREQGFRTYDFGGIGGLDDNVGVNRFKLQFGGEIVREHNYTMAGMPKLWRAILDTYVVVSARGRRRKQLDRAADRWRYMPLDQIRQTITTSVQNFEDDASARNRAHEQNFDPDVPEMTPTTR